MGRLDLAAVPASTRVVPVESPPPVSVRVCTGCARKKQDAFCALPTFLQHAVKLQYSDSKTKSVLLFWDILCAMSEWNGHVVVET